jgi:hypothetical protein
LDNSCEKCREDASIIGIDDEKRDKGGRRPVSKQQHKAELDLKYSFDTE